VDLTEGNLGFVFICRFEFMLKDQVRKGIMWFSYS